jgi:hypothetical protein
MFFFNGVTAKFTVIPDVFPIDKIIIHFIETLLSLWNYSK